MTYFIFSSRIEENSGFLPHRLVSGGRLSSIEWRSDTWGEKQKQIIVNMMEIYQSTFIVWTYQRWHAEVSRIKSNHTWLLNYAVSESAWHNLVFQKKKGDPTTCLDSSHKTGSASWTCTFLPEANHLCFIKNTLSRLIYSQILHSSDIPPKSLSSAHLYIFYLAPHWYFSKLSTHMTSSFLIRRCWDFGQH